MDKTNEKRIGLAESREVQDLAATAFAKLVLGTPGGEESLQKMVTEMEKSLKGLNIELTLTNLEIYLEGALYYAAMGKGDEKRGEFACGIVMYMVQQKRKEL